MQVYEINYLITQSKNAELEKLRQSIKNLFLANEAEIIEEKEYLKRKLAYEINRDGYGFFTVVRFKLEDHGKLNLIKKELNLNHDIARYIIVRAEHLPSLMETEKVRQRKEISDQKKSETETIKAEDVEKLISKTPEPKKEPEKETSLKTKSDMDKESDAEKKDDKSALDDLDKKLDEILNI